MGYLPGLNNQLCFLTQNVTNFCVWASLQGPAGNRMPPNAGNFNPQAQPFRPSGGPRQQGGQRRPFNQGPAFQGGPHQAPNQAPFQGPHQGSQQGPYQAPRQAPSAAAQPVVSQLHPEPQQLLFCLSFDYMVSCLLSCRSGCFAWPPVLTYQRQVIGIWSILLLLAFLLVA